MDSDILIVFGSLAVATIAVLVLRVPSLPAFFALIVGQLLVSYSGFGFIDQKVPEIAMMFGLFVVTVLLTRGRSHNKLSHELIPAICVAIVFLLMLYPMVGFLKTNFESADMFGIDQNKMNVFIGTSVVVLVVSILSHRKMHASSHGKHHR